MSPLGFLITQRTETETHCNFTESSSSFSSLAFFPALNEGDTLLALPKQCGRVALLALPRQGESVSLQLREFWAI